MKDIIFISPVLEYPPSGGPQLRIHNSIKVLSRLTNLHLFNRDRSLSRKEFEISRNYYRKLTFNFIDLIKLHQTNKNYILKKIILKLSMLCMNFFAIKHAFILVNYAKRKKIRFFWIGFGNLSFGLILFIKIFYPQSKVVFDTDSVWSRFILREVPYAKNTRRIILNIRGFIKKLEENFLTKFSDITTAVSEVDAIHYRKFVKQKEKIRIFANVVDLDYYNHKNITSKIEKDHPSIYLAGSFGHYNSPMDKAAFWMIEEILPLIWERIENAKFYLVGRNSEYCFKNYANHKNISITGKVESVLPYLLFSNVSVVPLKFESGTRFKIMEAAACNIPVVSTSLGSEGLDLVHNKDILLANDPLNFAKSVVDLINNKEKADYIAKNCREKIKKYYSLDSLEKQANKILKVYEND